MRKHLCALLLICVFYGNSLCDEYTDDKNNLSAQYKYAIPKQWGEKVEGVLTTLATKEKVIALTFDACGSKGDGFDSTLFDYLVKNKIQATFFVSGRWIDTHPAEFNKISTNDLFEIEDHGLNHKPASINGKSIYGIKGTENPAELIDEVELNAQKILRLTGKKTRFYRSGTAYYDEYAVRIIHELGFQIAGFSVLGDMGAQAR